jgi:hypothetical protein
MFVFKGVNVYIYHGGHDQECTILDQAGQAELRKCSRAGALLGDAREKPMAHGDQSFLSPRNKSFSPEIMTAPSPGGSPVYTVSSMPPYTRGWGRKRGLLYLLDSRSISIGAHPSGTILLAMSARYHMRDGILLFL